MSPPSSAAKVQGTTIHLGKPARGGRRPGGYVMTQKALVFSAKLHNDPLRKRRSLWTVSTPRAGGKGSTTHITSSKNVCGRSIPWFGALMRYQRASSNARELFPFRSGQR